MWVSGVKMEILLSFYQLFALPPSRKNDGLRMFTVPRGLGVRLEGCSSLATHWSARLPMSVGSVAVLLTPLVLRRRDPVSESDTSSHLQINMFLKTPGIEVHLPLEVFTDTP